jgi:lysyl-tRNA synthetase class 2
MDLELLQERARIIRDVRFFFDKRDYLETDIPLLSPDLIPESCLEVFEASRLFPPGSRDTKTGLEKKPEALYLIPSPEIWRKKLIARHRVSLYQICKCFRNGESTGRIHSPEFTMLEYYTMNAGYRDSLKITEDLFDDLSSSHPVPLELRPPFTLISMEEAFERWAGFDLFKAVENRRLEEEARGLGLSPPAGLGDAGLYDLIFIHSVEPNLPRDKPVALIDYPAFVPCLAKKGAGGKTVERWELYVHGIELANCFSEETEADEVWRFFISESAFKEDNALVRHKIDREYWKNFLPKKTADGEIPFPRCSGVAMGLDRLIMALTGRSTIDGVLPFPLE